MKKAAEAVLQFTGYPLPPTETAQNKLLAGARIRVMHKETESPTNNFFHVHRLSSDPLTWDGDWFGQYE